MRVRIVRAIVSTLYVGTLWADGFLGHRWGQHPKTLVLLVLSVAVWVPVAIYELRHNPTPDLVDVAWQPAGPQA
jgi:hypothetical protein